MFETRMALWSAYRLEIERNGTLQEAVRQADAKLTILKKRLLKVLPDYDTKFKSPERTFSAKLPAEAAAARAYDLTPLEELLARLDLSREQTAPLAALDQIRFETQEMAPLRKAVKDLNERPNDYYSLVSTSTIPIAVLKPVKLKTMFKNLRVAIDGPSGSGKSTVAKLLAKRYGLTYINTGLIYRAIAYLALQKQISVENSAVLEKLLVPQLITLLPDEEVMLNNKLVTKHLRADAVSQLASKLAALAPVREYAQSIAQAFAQKPGVVMDGRDTTFKIMPHADLKIFLDTAPEVRAQRRVEQNRILGFDTNYETILAEIKERDWRDRTRSVDPLHQVADAHLIDASALSIEAVLNQISTLLENLPQARGS